MVVELALLYGSSCCWSRTPKSTG